VDDGVSATVLWSYAVSAVAAGVATSPTLSLDGKKVAFVESAPVSRPHFHVLAWKSGDGVNPGNLQDVTQPRIINTFVPNAPVPGSGTATDLPFGFSGDTLSSPFIDFRTDTAYIGDDVGGLVRIKNVFCNVDPACFSATPPQPSLDTSWGTGGFALVGGFVGTCIGLANLTSPVMDPFSRNVYVGCADGNLYGFDQTGTPLANPFLAVGDGSPIGAIVDPPLLDVVNGFVYVSSGSDIATSTTAVAVQARTDLTSPRIASLGGSFANLHMGTFNDAYSILYVQGYDVSGTRTVLYGIGFDAAHNMNTGTPPLNVNLAIASECSPMFEFMNGVTDRLFFSLLGFNRLYAFNINSFPSAEEASAEEMGGTGGIVVDNVSSAGQASSIYFGNLAAPYYAVKRTQAGLQ
jgi:hypothetical protein